jgi:TetR/AcrR family transcriptional regulator of autoinduction and epiphytic fitness
MARQVKNRPYEMSNRARQAGETRRRIVEAAALLFVRDGYSATSIAAIAKEAEVAVPTVYATLRSKANILRAVIQLTVRGDDEAAPLASRAGWQEVEDEDDAEQQLALFAHFHREICEREAAVFAELEAAAGADLEATEMLKEHDQLRYEIQSRVAQSLRRRKHLRVGLNARKAADVIWTLASERTYLALVRDRGWKPDDYERWLRDQLVAALLPHQ